LDRRAIGQEFEPALPRAHAERPTEKAGSIFKSFRLSKDDSPFAMVGHSRPKDGVASARACSGHPRPCSDVRHECASLFRAAVIREQQRGRSHVRAQKRLTSHLIIGWCYSDVLSGRMDIAHATFEPAAHVGRS